MDKWEMCIFGLDNIVFLSPQNGTSVFPINEFIKKFIDSQTQVGWNDAPAHFVIPWILNNGWEPYASIPGTHFFRKKLDVI